MGMTQLFANYKCVCSHVDEYHLTSKQVMMIYAHNLAKCLECVALSEASQTIEFHEFKLDNLSYLESKLIEKENGK